MTSHAGNNLSGKGQDIVFPHLTFLIDFCQCKLFQEKQSQYFIFTSHRHFIDFFVIITAIDNKSKHQSAPY